ncbi:hypothetical protein B6N60_03713 [Richelia sinica FACHB-800]|uniref:Uncharacterized protein n=1 Tax=Richelia sinica FACHB-800 TaxID=1357546 RepID=A0A975Y684_9NOST|nr:hypothetical protein [Richelia sinica]MBD2664095.1 hypothetical protein [Richelia sinica FACHB-800]QXE25003.1 hypothetical protein B6N60_03713 [Richelia sinica FACHB-800]
MKSHSPFIATVIVAGMLAVVNAPFPAIHPVSAQGMKQEMKDATGLSSKQKIDMLNKSKGQFGSGDQLRRYFFGDLEPISVQPGGAGMVVNLYNKANNITISYCATYDVVVALKSGKITAFAPEEVK